LLGAVVTPCTSDKNAIIELKEQEIWSELRQKLRWKVKFYAHEKLTKRTLNETTYWQSQNLL